MENKEVLVYDKILDAIGKIAFTSSFVVAFAYISGYVFSWIFYNSLSAGWVIEFLSIADFVKVGMPRVAWCVTCSMLVLVVFKTSAAMRAVGKSVVLIYTLIFMVASNLLFLFFNILIEQYSIVNASAEAVMFVLASCSLAYAGRIMLEGERFKTVFVAAFISLFLVLVAIPAIQANQAADDLSAEQSERFTVYASGGNRLGVFVGFAGGRILTYDCGFAGSVRLLDSSAEVTIKAEATHCQNKVRRSR